MMKKCKDEFIIDPSLLYLESLLQTLNTSCYDDDITKQIIKLKKLVIKKVYQDFKPLKDVVKTEYKIVVHYDK